jgi:hypothetical protein
MAYRLRNSADELRVQLDRQPEPTGEAKVKVLHLHGDEDTLIPTDANSKELARRYCELVGQAKIVLLKGLGAERAGARSHDGPELYESAALLKFLPAD